MSEALAISEVTYLCRTQYIQAIVIKGDVEVKGASDLGQHFITIRLKPNAKTSEVIEVLWQLFPSGPSKIQ